tara:strand:+ start:91 stop:348 length:258 start_codon:yes stop_codon:yes gene_type:complete
VTSPVDPRFDKLVHYTLLGFASLAASVGAWFGSTLATEVRSLRDDLANLRTEVRVHASVVVDVGDIRKRLREAELRISKCEERAY